MPLDPQVEYVLALIRKAGNPEYWQMTPEQARDWHNRKAAILDIEPQPVYRIEDRAIPGVAGDVPVRLYTPRAPSGSFPVLVWLHGGGHVVGNINSYDALCRSLALQADCLVVSVDYRLAPEHKFPAGVEDSFAALAWVGEQAAEFGGDPTRIAIGGDSAGANLAAVCAILARDSDFPPLVFQLLVYPRTAPDEEFPSHHAFAEGYVLTRKTILWFHDHYRRSEEDRKDFRYAPLICPDLSRLPPALVIVGEYDPLRDDGIAYAERLEREGNTVELAHYAGMVHPFFSMGGAIDAGRRAQAQAATALRQAFARRAAETASPPGPVLNLQDHNRSAMHNRDTLYINGTWAASSGAGSINVINAATEEVMGRVPEGTPEDVDRAVAAARAAFEPWAATPVAKRADYLAAMAAGLKARADEIAHTITGEVGMPLKLSLRIQAGLPAANLGTYAKLVTDFPFEERVGNSLVVREPRGVVGCITPWNYPLHQVVAKVAPALAAGNTVVLKPADLAPLSAFILAEVIAAAGLPPGVFNLVSGHGRVVGEALVKHPDVDMISFTGSTDAGQRVAALAAGTVKRVALELGGKSAAIVLEDADLPAAVKSTVNACFLNAGQTCNALTRLLVPHSRYAAVAELAVHAAHAFTPGDPLNEGTKLGPLVSAAQRDTVRDYIRKGMAAGAELLTGGPEAPEGLEHGYFVKATVFGRVDPKSTIAQEEIFGPVLSIIPYRDEDDAVRIANDSIYGLAGAVWSADETRGMQVARRLRTGQVDVNGAPFNLLAPFGGYKQSGHGRELGRFGLEEFTELKAIQLKTK